MPTAGKQAFVDAVARDAPASVLEVGTGAGEATRLLRARVARVTSLDLEPGNRPDVVADACALPFTHSQFDVVCTDSVVNQLGSRLALALVELTRVAQETARLVVREWLPPRGDDPRDELLRAMHAARLLDGDDYATHPPELVGAILSGLGWADVRRTVHEEPTDDQQPDVHPLGEPRHERLRPVHRAAGPGIASSYVLTASRGNA